ncbi:MAG: YkgJ family cysteine cluster protein [Cyclobacteriaceae bacterium]
MSIVIKVKQVQRLFDRLEIETENVKHATGMHCLTGCGNCCMKPDIEASVLEFLPFAFDLFLKRQTELFKIRLEDSGSICLLFNPLSVASNTDYQQGKCGEYANRGLICRLFGYATIRDKNGQNVLSTCKWIKTTQLEEVAIAQSLIVKKQVPGFLNYYQRLVQIDFKLSQELLPINEAIGRAIAEVEHYYLYRPFPYGQRKIA